MAKPVVSIIMGSDSDLEVMVDSAKALEEFEIPHEMTIISAHRSPKKMTEYVSSAKARGIKIIIAGAGGAAHLAGVAASLTALPIIGVPIQSKTLSGVDSLYSIVQMPPGVPVATVAINGAKNAGLLAIQILALSDTTLSKKLEKYKTAMEKKIVEKGEKLMKLKAEEYLKQM